MEQEGVAVMRRNALILATANYDDPAFRPLPSVHADAWYLPQVLEDPAIGGFEQVQVVKDAPATEMRAATIDFLKRFASSGDVIGVVLAGWRHETNRLSP